MTNTLINVAETFGLTEGQTMPGVSPLVRRQYTPQRKAAIVEATRLWDRVWNQGDPRAAITVQEALATSDLFKSATGDVFDRELLARYGDVNTQWTQIASRTTVRNFKPKKMVDIMGGRTSLALVPELIEYPGADTRTNEYEIAVKKFGRRVGWSWESSINDELDELQTIPGNFAVAARITEDDAVFDRLFDRVTGAPSAAFFKDYTGAPIAGPNTTAVTAALTSENLQAAITAVTTRRDFEGNLIPAGRLQLVVGRGQEINARRILTATEVRTVVGSRTTIEANPLAGAVDLTVVDRLPGLSWFLLPTPNGGGRPAISIAFLRGWETPDIRVRSQAGNRPGGGPVDPGEGDFDVDAIYWRVRHIVGSAVLDPTHTYASTGAGA